MKHLNTKQCKPFLRWAGGKSWFIKSLSDFLPKDGFKRYHEPFIGGGAVFFHIQPKKAIISDLNTELIETYIQIKTNVDEVIKHLKTFENSKEFYYKIREQNLRNDAKKAARFIYLNQTSFNGIYRVNLKGKYNVPYGYRTKEFYNPNQLKTASAILKKTIIKSCDFTKTIKSIKEKDLVFLDPPYTVTHNNNGFIKYNSKLFDEESQIKLSEFIDEIRNRNAYYILTNAAHQWVKKTFNKKGDRCIDLSRASLIGGKKAKRGKYNESIFTNIIN